MEVTKISQLDDVGIQKILEFPSMFKKTATPFPLGQHWRSQPEEGLRPATAWLAAAKNSFAILADLADAEIVTSASADNQPLWELGDVFEVFLHCAEAEGYFEFQVAPNGFTLELEYPHIGAPRDQGIEGYILSRKRVEAAVKTYPEDGYWRIAALIPIRSILGDAPRASGREWKVAFCRYDYDQDRQYRVSSSAKLSVASFHRVHEWTSVIVREGFDDSPVPSSNE